MRVAVEASAWSNRRGYGRFARNAVGRLIELDRENEYVLVGREATEPASGTTRPLREVLSLARATSGRRFDVVLFPSVYSYFPVVGPRVVVGIHDTTTSDFPELTLPSRSERLAWAAKERLALRQARRVFTVSEAARAAVRSRYGIDAAVVPEAPDPVFFPREREEPGQYVLYAAGLGPHKSVETLLEAYAPLYDAPPLLLLGGDDPYLSARAAVEAAIDRLGLKSRVSISGYVDDERLAELYSGAAAVVCTSLAEGFGLPPVEAAACGAAVVLSDIPAHRETLGDAALFFPPRDAEALRDQLENLLADVELRASLGARARERVSRLTWDASAEALRRVLEAAAE